ncbi:MAG TPA: HAD hydrolase-like protein, partial [Stellaceae bacterium]|nr:HAD hydrolase-like protein [Stellaceae bacterium]
CPDHPEMGPSLRRKPGPLMMREAAAELGLDLARSWTIGDKASDIEAGRAAGIGTLLRYDPEAPRWVRERDHWVIPRLLDAATLLDRSGQRT